MEDLLVEINADRLSKTEIKTAIEKDDNKHSLAIVNSTKAVGTKKKTQRNKVRASILKRSADGKSLAGLYEIELAMNDLKVDGLINDMKSLKACIEWVFNDLVKDKEEPFYVKENRQSMKNVTIEDDFPCVMSDVLPERRKNVKDIDTESADVIVNLTEDDKNSFESKNKILFQTMTELNKENELVINEEEFTYIFTTLTAKLRNELRTKRKEVQENAEVEEVEDAA